MAQITKITDDVVKIGLDNGSLISVRREDISYSPIQVGDEVNVFQDGMEVAVSKKKNTMNADYPPQGGININVSNSANNTGNNYVAQGAHVVHKLTYCLLCLFLGWLGVHQFYAGKGGMGILYLFTAGICYIGCVVDFVSNVFKKADSNGNIVV